MYNLDTYDNVTGLADFMIKLNVSSGGIFAPVILFGIWIVIFLSSRVIEEDFSKCALGSSIATVLVGMFFLFTGFLDWKTFTITLILVFASLIIFSFRKD